jgi:hypothetical protein
MASEPGEAVRKPVCATRDDAHGGSEREVTTCFYSLILKILVKTAPH